MIAAPLLVKQPGAPEYMLNATVEKKRLEVLVWKERVGSSKSTYDHTRSVPASGDRTTLTHPLASRFLARASSMRGHSTAAKCEGLMGE